MGPKTLYFDVLLIFIIIYLNMTGINNIFKINKKQKSNINGKRK